MTKNSTKIAISLGLLLVAYLANSTHNTPKKAPTTNTPVIFAHSPVTLLPVEHATAFLSWGSEVILTDPVQDPATFAKLPKPTLILITDIHGDHFSTSTLSAISDSASIIAPRAVVELMTPELKKRTTVLANGQTITVRGLSITGVPMYNIPETPTAMHTKGRGNGYVISVNNYKVYIAGDTSGTPEMKALKGIDMAFIPMNLPYTMWVDEAADATLAFAPKIAIPYHYRGKDGLSDTSKYKSLVNAKNASIDVELLNWYPNTK